ncbi:MAG TPA: hypothetical protein VFZ78_06415, partial [Flavisolibacter sp.]
MTKFYLLIFSGLILFAGCKSASKAYEKGNYADAFELGVKKLQKDPDDWETRQLVQNAYNYAISNHEDRIRILGNSRNDNRYAEIYREYLHMQDMYNTIRAYPNAFRQVRVNDYSSFLETYGEKSATVHIQKAEQWLQEGTRTAFREAYHEYHLASNYLPHDFQLRRKKDSVYNLAVTKVLI